MLLIFKLFLEFEHSLVTNPDDRLCRDESLSRVDDKLTRNLKGKIGNIEKRILQKEKYNKILYPKALRFSLASLKKRLVLCAHTTTALIE